MTRPKPELVGVGTIGHVAEEQSQSVLFLCFVLKKRRSSINPARATGLRVRHELSHSKVISRYVRYFPDDLLNFVNGTDRSMSI